VAASIHIVLIYAIPWPTLRPLGFHTQYSLRYILAPPKPLITPLRNDRGFRELALEWVGYRRCGVQRWSAKISYFYNHSSTSLLFPGTPSNGSRPLPKYFGAHFYLNYSNCFELQHSLSNLFHLFWDTLHSLSIGLYLSFPKLFMKLLCFLELNVYTKNVKCIIKYKVSIEQVGSSCNASDLHSESARFESQPENRLFWYLSWLSSVPSGKYQDSTLKFGHDRFISHSFQFIIIYSLDVIQQELLSAMLNYRQCTRRNGLVNKTTVYSWINYMPFFISTTLYTIVVPAEPLMGIIKIHNMKLQYNISNNTTANW
jgi:hypothetical protein